jgi:S-adenosyl-L-methionine hydrolase (adenosine-forming)
MGRRGVQAGGVRKPIDNVNIITLTTDFGVQDWFVGTMKGVILGIQPRAQLVDITHQIPPGDIMAGALALAAAFRYFPNGTVHLVVVDPGVGSARGALAAQTDCYKFVGPDNGVLSLALKQSRPRKIHRLESARYFLDDLSQTFHGRDLFAPVAAHLSRGVPVRALGRPVQEYARLLMPEPNMKGGRVLGVVVYVDRFGNAITNIPRAAVTDPDNTGWRVSVARQRRSFPVGQCYQCVGCGCPLGIWGSVGLLEVAVNGGSAADVLSLAKGDPVRLQLDKWRRAKGER